MVLRGVREKEKGASRKESEKARGLRCSGAADREKEAEKDNVLCVLSVLNFKNSIDLTLKKNKKRTNIHL